MRIKHALPTLAATALLSSAAAGCGFGDELTARGFVLAGDTICAGSAVQAAAERERLRAAGQVLDEEAIRALATSYSSIASGLRTLELNDDDSEFRNTMAGRYNEAARKIGVAADQAAAGDAAAPAEALDVVEGLRPFAKQVRAYGFRACGGQTPAS